MGRKTGDLGIPGKHPGLTHSCFFLTFLIGTVVTLSVFGWQFLISHRIVLDPQVTRLLTTGTIALFLTVMLHILADSFTKMGVWTFWPDQSLIAGDAFYEHLCRAFFGSVGDILLRWDTHCARGY